MLQPVAGVEEKVAWRKLVTHRDVPVRENKAFNIGGLQHLAGEQHLVLVLPFEDEHALIVGVAALFGKEPRDGERLPRMQHAVQPLVELAVENPLDEQVFALFPSQPVSMPHETTEPVDGEQSRLTVDYRPERLREIILHPHVVVARKVVDLNPLRIHLLQAGEQHDIPFRNHIAVLEPVVENVAQQKKMLKFTLQTLK